MISLLLLLVLVLPLSIIHGYIANVLWGWFLTPAFGWAAPGAVVMAGISLVVGVLRPATQPPKYANVQEAVAAVVLGPFFVLFVGWILHFFV